jgi:aminoglycoside-2''-adenylyltransferase
VDPDVTNDTAPGAAGPTLADPLAEALRLVALADARGLQVRLMGGLSFHARVRDWTAMVQRAKRDIDLATRSRDRKALSDLMTAEGYTADRRYNALYGHKQLYFMDEARQRPADVLVDRLEMCHMFEFADRLTVADVTLPPAEMLLSKLQVVKINHKDVLDSLALLSEYPLAEGDDAGRAISLRRITSLTSNDWGWWRTVTGNLDKLLAIADGHLKPGELEFGRPSRFEATAQVAALRKAIDAGSKSTRWKLRSRIGDRVAWYQEPEEIGHGD